MIHSRQIVEYKPFRLRKHAETTRTVLVRMNNETWSKISCPCWLREGNNSICIGQKKERDTGTFLFNSVLKTGTTSNHKVNRKYFGKGKNRKR